MRPVAVIAVVFLLLAGCSPQDAQPTPVTAAFAPNRILPAWETARDTANGVFAGQPWQFVGQQGDQIHLQLVSPSAGLTLSLQAPDGSIVDRGNDIRATLPDAGIYTAVVRFAPGESASYALTLRYTDRLDPAQPTPEPSLTPAPTISPTPTTTPTPTPVFAALGRLIGRIADGSPANGQFDGDADDHIYLFDGLSGQYANIQMARIAGPVDPAVLLYDPQGNPLAGDDNSGEGSAAQLRNILLPVSGEYILRASGDPARGEYRLGVTLSIERQPVTPNIPPPTATATPTPTAEPRADRLLDHVPVSGQLARPGDFARYPIVALQGEILTIGVSPVGGSGLRPQIELYSPSGELVRQASVALSNAGGDALIPAYQAGESGTYVALVLGENGTTGEFVVSYGLGMSRENVLRGPVFADQVVTGDIAHKGLRDVWTVYLNAGDVITATANPQSGLFDPLLELAAPDGSVIARDDNGGGGRVPLIAGARATATGAYLLRVTGANAASSGAYTLVWRYVAAAPTATPPAATILLMSVDDTVPERTYLDYPFQGQAGQRVLIRITAGRDSSLDPVVALLSADGTALARADDNGDDLNPVLDFVLPFTGTYFARVDGYQSSGRFELTVEALY